jgi:hypothetical protein
MGTHEELWERLKTISDEEWMSLRNRRDRLARKRRKKPSAADFAGRISEEDLDIMEREIEEHCERIDPDGWR